MVYPIPLIRKIKARVYLNEISHPVIPGSKYKFHFGLITQLGIFRKIHSEYDDAEFKKLLRKKPRLINSRAFAEVQIKLDKRTPIENIENFKAYGIFQISNEFDTIGHGRVIQLIN